MTDIAEISSTGDLVVLRAPAAAGSNDLALALAAKRTVDVVLAATFLVLLAPLLLVIAVAVKLSSHGPVFFQHERVGRNGEMFRLLKFRTMASDTTARIHADPDLHRQYVDNDFKLPGSALVTPLGRFLRMTSLDELPQLLHVLTGRMSLVGVRPVEPAQFAMRDTEARDAYLAMRPGLTGLWQVRGRSTLTADERCRLDTRYVEEWSVAEDIMILLRTPAAVLRFSETA